MTTYRNVENTCRLAGIDPASIPADIRALPVVRNARLQKTVAQAVYSGPDREPARIEMGPRLDNANGQTLREVFAHEVAHLIAGYDADHGPHWKRIAMDLGCSGSKFATPATIADIGSAYKVVAKCSDCGDELRRTRRLPKGRNYSHRGCGGRFVAV